MSNLYFKTDSNGFNAANQATSAGATRKLFASGGTDGTVTATDVGFTLNKGVFAASDAVAGANGAFGLTMVVKTAADPEKYRPRLARYNSAGALQATFEPTDQDASIIPGQRTTFDTLTWSFPSVDLGTWAEGDVLVAGVLFAQFTGGRRGVSNVFAMDGQSFVTVPW